ncbi:MAG: sensor domain-containing diguanylate cyclase [Burkholderiales bacterium]|nr:sensor domain-containing diguanylate cyclase [Burkholderiales bacterium]
MHRHHPRLFSMINPVNVLWIAIAVVSYYLAARTGMALFSLKPSNITLLWLASGIGMIICMRFGTWGFLMIVLASFMANYPGMLAAGLDNAVLHTLINAFADALAGMSAMLLMRRFLPAGLRRATDLLRFGMAVCLLPTLMSSLIIGFNLGFYGYIKWSETGNFIRMLIVADSLGILLVFPLFQAWQAEEMPQSAEWINILIALLAITALLTLAFNGYPGFIYFIFPVLLILAFYVRLSGVCLALTFGMIAIIAATGHRLGPFQSSNQVEAQFMLVSFVCTITFTILGVALHNQQLRDANASSQQWKLAAEYDALTHLLNRSAFLPVLQEEHQRAQRTGRSYALALLDLDFFKHVNDVYGHQTGDAVLEKFASLMQENVRGFDKVARLGGEEFAILFPDSSAADARVSMERLRARLELTPLHTPSGTISVTASIGIAEYKPGLKADATPDGIRAEADQFLYAAKNAGRNCVVSG